jgi:hypothetical protein
MHDIPAAALVGVTVDCMFYAIDSYKVMKQGKGGISSGKMRISSLFRGMLPGNLSFYTFSVTLSS